MKKLFALFSFLLSLQLFSQTDTIKKYKEEDIILETATGKIYGTLMLPDSNSNKKTPVTLIIAGSGPTDRNGNNPLGVKCNTYKMLAEQMAEIGIASVRYDKRGIAKSVESGGKDESKILFTNMVDDASAWMRKLKSDNRFNKIVVMGHSEGSFIGMIAANATKPDVYVSLAGIATRADSVLMEQINRNSPMVASDCEEILNKLAKGDTVGNVSPMLYTLFRPSIQPYLISWFKYSPRTEIAKLTCPILIFQGEIDIQVHLSEAKKLQAANPKMSKAFIIEGMTHTLKTATEDSQVANMKTYNTPKQPLTEEFVKKLKEELLNALK